MIGKVLSYGNTDQRVTVLLLNGLVVRAIAGNDINSTDVAVMYASDEKEFYAWSETSPITVLRHTEGVQSFPKVVPQEEVVDILPFQVLFTPSVQLGGDRPQVALGVPDSVVIGGINNLGEQQYISVWLEPTQFVVDNNGTQTVTPYTLNVDPSEFEWIGNGYLNAQTFPVKPPFDPTITVTSGAPYPFDFEIPLYPRFFPRQDTTALAGVTTTQQNNQAYAYTKTETYTYQNDKTGNAPDADPNIFDIPVVCNFTNSGVPYNFLYERFTVTDYVASTNELHQDFVVNYFNGNVNSGERTDQTIETQDYQAGNTFFSSAVDYLCSLVSGPPVIGFYDWVSVGNIVAIWSGETTTYDRDYTRTITEQWNKNMSANFTREQRQLFTEVYTEDYSYVVPSDTWALSPLTSGFQFFVDGSEIQDIDITRNNDQVTPNPILISNEGSSVLFSERTQSLNEVFTSDRDRTLQRSAAYNYTGDVTNNSWTEVSTVSQSDETKFYLALGDVSLVDIDLNDAFLFSVINADQISILEGGFTSLTLVNLDSSDIYEAPLDYATNFVATTDVILSNTAYTSTTVVEFPYWSTIAPRTVYMFANDKRYTAELLGIAFADSPDPALPIQTIRTVSEITIFVTAVEDYLEGIAEPNEIVIAPLDNLALLLRDRLLSDGNKKFCNLFGSTLYFAKSVLTDFSTNSHSAEVYDIQTKVTQLTPVSGPFVPVTGVSDVLGISYLT